MKYFVAVTPLGEDPDYADAVVLGALHPNRQCERLQASARVVELSEDVVDELCPDLSMCPVCMKPAVRKLKAFLGIKEEV